MHGFGTVTDQDIIKFDKNFLDQYKLSIDPTIAVTQHIQSLSHCLHPEIKYSLLSKESIQNKICSIGQKTIEHMLNITLKRELEFAETHYVFYHGCKIEFLLFQDLLKFLTEITYKNVLHDFFLLRIPEHDYSTFHTVQSFLLHQNFDINDSLDPARQLLLSVNPSLFGNSIHRETSSAFCYFLNSKTAFSIDTLPIVHRIFDHYKHPRLYYQHQSELQHLTTHLTSYEGNKTGILLQIFIPKEDIDSIVYRSLPRGIPYHGRSFLTRPSLELHDYQQNNLSIKNCSGVKLDEMQFRILLNTNHMLNPHNETSKNPIKIFRYYNQTAHIKEYCKEIESLKNTIRMELS